MLASFPTTSAAHFRPTFAFGAKLLFIFGSAELRGFQWGLGQK
jgi:hypothetical protein